MLSWILVSTVALAEPASADPINVTSSVVSDEQPILSVQEIYALLDDERWSKGIIEARRLVASEPDNGLARLTLGDALSHYPSEKGDVYLAFEEWMTAKSLTPPRSSIHRVSEKRIGWALERSGILKLEPAADQGLDDGLRVEVFTAKSVDWKQRIEKSNGAVYVTNIPPGDVVLKVTSDLGVHVAHVSVDAGGFNVLAVPTDTDASQVDDQTAWMPYFEQGRTAVDAVVQSQITDPRIQFDRFEESMVQLPKAPVPVGSTTTFISPYNERITYNNGARQTLVGGLYVLEVEKSGVKTFADIVVHPDLSIETIRQLVLNDDVRRTVKESPIQRFSMLDSQVVEPETIAVEAVEPEQVDAGSATNEGLQDASTVAENDTSTVSEAGIVQSEIEPQQDPVIKTDRETSTDQNVDIETPSLSTATPTMIEEEDRDSFEAITKTASPVESTDVFLWKPETARTVQRTTLAVGGVVALGSGIAVWRADHFADLANAETESQRQFDEYTSQSEQWRSVFVMSSVAIGNVASFYLGSKWLERMAVDKSSQQNTLMEPDAGVYNNGLQTEGEEQ